MVLTSASQSPSKVLYSPLQTTKMPRSDGDSSIARPCEAGRVRLVVPLLVVDPVDELWVGVGRVSDLLHVGGHLAATGGPELIGAVDDEVARLRVFVDLGGDLPGLGAGVGDVPE